MLTCPLFTTKVPAVLPVPSPNTTEPPVIVDSLSERAKLPPLSIVKVPLVCEYLTVPLVTTSRLFISMLPLARLTLPAQVSVLPANKPPPSIVKVLPAATETFTASCITLPAPNVKAPPLTSSVVPSAITKLTSFAIEEPLPRVRASPLTFIVPPVVAVIIPFVNSWVEASYPDMVSVPPVIVTVSGVNMFHVPVSVPKSIFI